MFGEQAVQVVVDDRLGFPGGGQPGQAIVPGSHGGFSRTDELNDRIAAFIRAQAARPAG